MLVPGQKLGPEHKPSYHGGPIPLREYRGKLHGPDPLPKPSAKNVLLVNVGGDCCGYATINAAAYAGLKFAGFRVFGSINGLAGLTNSTPQIIELTPELMDQGDPEREVLLATGPRRRGPLEGEGIPGVENPLSNFLTHTAPFLGGLGFTGGEGTLQLLARLLREGYLSNFSFAGASMDGNIAALDDSVGFASTLAYDIEGARSVVKSASYCNKVHFFKTMGAHGGRLPLEVAMAVGAEAVIIPETGVVDLDAIYASLFASLRLNKGSVLVLGEAGSYRDLSGKVHPFTPQKGLSNAQDLAELEEVLKREMNEISKQEGYGIVVDTRLTSPGHTQRQPPIVAKDRNLACNVGTRLAQALINRNFATVIPSHPGEPIALERALSPGAHEAHRALVLGRFQEFREYTYTLDRRHYHLLWSWF